VGSCEQVNESLDFVEKKKVLVILISISVMELVTKVGKVTKVSSLLTGTV
jgi:hypothetical protein